MSVRTDEETATSKALSYRRVYAVAALALVAGLAVGACTSRSSSEIKIPPAQSVGSTLVILPQEVGIISSAVNKDTPPDQRTPVSSPSNYFGPNAIGTGTTSGPSPNMPFVDSVASCAAILDPDARQLCLQRAGSR